MYTEIEVRGPVVFELSLEKFEYYAAIAHRAVQIVLISTRGSACSGLIDVD